MSATSSPPPPADDEGHSVVSRTFLSGSASKESFRLPRTDIRKSESAAVDKKISHLTGSPWAKCLDKTLPLVDIVCNLHEDDNNLCMQHLPKTA